MLNAVGGPSNIKPNDPNNPYPGLTNFSLLTHGFGNPTINSSLTVLQTYLQELLAYYESRKPIQPDGQYLFPDKLPPPSVNGIRNPPAGYTQVGTNPAQGMPLLQGSSELLSKTAPGVDLKTEPVDSPSGCAT